MCSVPSVPYQNSSAVSFLTLRPTPQYILYCTSAATFLRPSHDQKLRRRAFNLFHHWTGRIAAGFAIANVYVGLHLYDKWDSSPRLGYILYSVLLGVVVGVAILKVRGQNLAEPLHVLPARHGSQVSAKVCTSGLISRVHVWPAITYRAT